MQVKISDIPPEGLEVEFLGRLDSPAVEADFRATLKRVGSDVLLEGEVSAEVPLECSRCLEHFTERVTVPISLSFGSEQDLREGEYELNVEEVSRALVDDDVIDLDQVAQEQIVLSLPMKPLCREECKGICPQCGAALNEGDCVCVQTEVDPRFDVLKKFLSDKGEKKKDG